MSEARLRVLVVEDDPWAAAAFKKALAAADASAEFEVVFDEKQALTRLRGCPPDVGFVSLDLPGCGALRLLRQLRPGEERPPIVVVASDRADPRIHAAVEAGAAETLFRGFRPGELSGFLTTLARYWHMLPAT